MTLFRTAGLGILGSALLAVAAAKPWGAVSQADFGDRFQSAGEVPLASALSLVALAAWGAILVTRGRVRQVIAVVGLVAAAAIVGVAIPAFTGAPDAVSKAASVPGVAPTAGHLTGWYFVSVVAALLATTSFFFAVRSARSWPSMSSRYDAPSGQPPVETPSSNQELWKAIDAGDDPTAGEGPNH